MFVVFDMFKCKSICDDVFEYLNDEFDQFHIYKSKLLFFKTDRYIKLMCEDCVVNKLKE